MAPLAGYYYAPVVPYPDRRQPVNGHYTKTDELMQQYQPFQAAQMEHPFAEAIQTWLFSDRVIRPHIQAMCPPGREIILMPIPPGDVIGGMLKNLPELGMDIITINDVDYPLSLLGAQHLDVVDTILRSNTEPHRPDRHWAAAFEAGTGVKAMIEFFMEMEMGVRVDAEGNIVLGTRGFGKLSPDSQLDLMEN